ncbi:hypothetical protein SK128_014035 [Halocaridina rubra]|uniref:Sulfotransferase n=1 Tax=Halocaridina rubra TaxID=373956 RepID=A0AAN8XR49_HALRR
MARRRKSVFTLLLLCLGSLFIIIVLINVRDLKDPKIESGTSSATGQTKNEERDLNPEWRNTSKPTYAKVSFNSRHSEPISRTLSQNESSITNHRSKKNSILSKSSILILSSVARSGTGFLGELLAALEHSFYIQEPVRAWKRGPQRKEFVQEELIKSFRCQISARFLQEEHNNVSVPQPYKSGQSKQPMTRELQNACEREPSIIIKNTRIRLGWTKRLLDLEDLNLKVLHIVRDPRGSLKSMDLLHWNVSIRDMCQRLTTVS